jgi:hypothetical protein
LLFPSSGLNPTTENGSSPPYVTPRSAYLVDSGPLHYHARW